jgi:hypothetical protein
MTSDANCKHAPLIGDLKSKNQCEIISERTTICRLPVFLNFLKAKKMLSFGDFNLNPNPHGYGI